MPKKNRRPQTPKGRDYSRAMRALDLRQGSRTDLHRDRAKYDRNDLRNMAQRGIWEV